MNDPASLPLSPRLEAAVVEFLLSVERGESPDRAALLDRYSDVAGELSEFFADHDRMDGLARPKKTTDRRLEQPAVDEPGAPGSSDVTWRPIAGDDAADSFRIGHYEIVDEIGRAAWASSIARGIGALVARLHSRRSSADDWP